LGFVDGQGGHGINGDAGGSGDHAVVCGEIPEGVISLREFGGGEGDFSRSAGGGCFEERGALPRHRACGKHGDFVTGISGTMEKDDLDFLTPEVSGFVRGNRGVAHGDLFQVILDDLPVFITQGGLENDELADVSLQVVALPAVGTDPDGGIGGHCIARRPGDVEVRSIRIALVALGRDNGTPDGGGDVIISGDVIPAVGPAVVQFHAPTAVGTVPLMGDLVGSDVVDIGSRRGVWSRRIVASLPENRERATGCIAKRTDEGTCPSIPVVEFQGRGGAVVGDPFLVRAGGVDDHWSKRLPASIDGSPRLDDVVVGLNAGASVIMGHQ